MKRLYAVFDKKAQAYGSVMVVAHHAQATREFVAGVEQEKSVLAKYPEDFELRCVGWYYDEEPDRDGPVFSIAPEVVITAEQVLAMRPREMTLVKEA